MLSEDSAKQMEAFMQAASETERHKIEDVLRRETGIDNRKKAAQAELQHAERNHDVHLHRAPEDPFRALSRCLHVQSQNVARHVAAASVKQAEANNIEFRQGGYMSAVKDALEHERPLPLTPAPYGVEDCRETLQILARTCPVKVLLLCTLPPNLEYASPEAHPDKTLTELTVLTMITVLTAEQK